MKDFSIDDFAAIVGIDWADKKHDICELPVGSKDYQWTVISSQPADLHAWATAYSCTVPSFDHFSLMLFRWNMLLLTTNI